MFRVRRLILRLTLAGGLIPLVCLLVALIVPDIGKGLGRSGHPIGKHYVVRYISDYQAIKIYRDGYEQTVIALDLYNLKTSLAWYGVICLTVGSTEGVIRSFGRRASRRRGFEVLQTPCTSNDSHSAAAIPACRPHGN